MFETLTRAQIIDAMVALRFRLSNVQGHNEALCTEIERLTLENWQLKGALGYPIPGDVPGGQFKCGLCEARRATDGQEATTKDATDKRSADTKEG